MCIKIRANAWGFSDSNGTRVMLFILVFMIVFAMLVMQMQWLCLITRRIWTMPPLLPAKEVDWGQRRPKDLDRTMYAANAGSTPRADLVLEQFGGSRTGCPMPTLSNADAWLCWLAA